MAKDSPYLPWRISGTYLEACNCEAICPCRRVGGRQGGRSTGGVCLGSLSWQIDTGFVARLLDGTAAAEPAVTPDATAVSGASSA